MAAMIDLDRVGVSFQPNEWLFRNVSLSVRAEECVAIVGPSGDGKSTLLKVMARLLTPTEGSVSCASDEVSVLFQNNALFNSMTVQDNLIFPAVEVRHTQPALAEKRAQSLLESVGLAGSEALMPDDLSGGMQKRLGIARALATDPKVVLYDEPTAGLDPINSRKITNLIGEMKKERSSTVVFVTNEMPRAFDLADRLLFVAGGEIVDAGSPDDFDRAPQAFRDFVFGKESA